MGAKTPNDIFYKPAIAASGAVEKGKFDDGLDVADGLIEGNKPENNKLSAFAATTSAELAGVISDEVGTGKAVFNDSPVFITKITTPIIDLTGGQVKFPAIANSSANANTLDDYEEGTWTPSFYFGGATVGVTYSVQSGIYVKVGRKVTLTGNVTLTDKGSSSGYAEIRDLPFTCADLDGGYAPVTIRPYNITYDGQIFAIVNKNSTAIAILENNEAGTSSDITNINCADNSRMIISVTYFTD